MALTKNSIWKDNYTGEECKFEGTEKMGKHIVGTMRYLKSETKTGTWCDDLERLEQTLNRNWTEIKTENENQL